MDARLARYIGRRLVLAVGTVWGVSTLVFLLMKVIPGDQAAVAAGAGATPEQIEQVRHRLGFDQSVPAQYWHYLVRLVHGDLGTSTFTYRPVAADLADALPSTVELVAAAMLLNLLVAVPIGIYAAARENQRPDSVIRVLAILLGAIPLFWLGLLLQYVFSVRLGALPVSGVLSGGIEVSHITGLTTVDALLSGNGEAFLDASAHLVLPAVALAIPFMAFVIRIVRAAMTTALAADFITVAQAKGVSTSRLMIRHALRNCLAPIVNLVGLQFGWMIGGAVLIESVFSRPGIGNYLTQAVQQKDTFAALGVVIFTGAIVAVASLVVDLIQILADVRVRVQQIGARA